MHESGYQDGEKWLLVFCDPVRDPEIMGADKMTGFHAWAVLQGIKLLKPGFRHVFAMRPAGCEGWLIVDQRVNQLGVFHMDFDYIVKVRELEKAGIFTVLEVNKTHCKQVRGFLGSGLLSCVAVMRRLIGVTAPVITPFGLYRHLRNKQHGGDVFNTEKARYQHSGTAACDHGKRK